jgi:hypothetical protein
MGKQSARQLLKRAHEMNALVSYSDVVTILRIVLAVGTAAGLALVARGRVKGDVGSVQNAVMGTNFMFALGLLMMPFLPLHDSEWIVLDFVAIGIALAAAFFGFLFALPQLASPGSAGPVMENETSSAIYHSSTNLETVAEQLTRFVAGAAFASLAVAGSQVSHFGQLVKSALTNPPPSAELLGDALFIMYSTLGFTIAYLITRTELSPMLQRTRDQFRSSSSLPWEIALLDATEALTPENRAIVERIADYPFDARWAKNQRLMWARAKTLAGRTKDARHAHAALYAANANDLDTVVEFVLALKNDPTFTDAQYILSLQRHAEQLVSTENDARLSRIAQMVGDAPGTTSGGN